MATKYRINFLTSYGGSYKVVSACYLVDSNGSRILPAGTQFSWSPNQYADTINFMSGYVGTNQWHSDAATYPDTPFWGVVEFPEPQDVAGIVWRATGPYVSGRSPKAWSIEEWNETDGQWVLLRERQDEPPWEELEIRTYSLIPLDGRVVDMRNNAMPRVVVFDWLNPANFHAANVSSDGRWRGIKVAAPYGIYYLSSANCCPPIIHGPYTE